MNLLSVTALIEEWVGLQRALLMLGCRAWVSEAAAAQAKKSELKNITEINKKQRKEKSLKIEVFSSFCLELNAPWV